MPLCGHLFLLTEHPVHVFMPKLDPGSMIKQPLAQTRENRALVDFTGVSHESWMFHLGTLQVDQSGAVWSRFARSLPPKLKEFLASCLGPQKKKRSHSGWKWRGPFRDSLPEFLDSILLRSLVVNKKCGLFSFFRPIRSGREKRTAVFIL